MKIFSATALAILLAATASADYWVVMKDGQKYHAKAKWSVSGGKAIFTLTNGQTLTVDPSAIDAAKSDQVTRLGGADLIAIEQAAPTQAPAPSSLGSQIRLRNSAQQNTAPTPPPVAAAPRPSGAGAVPNDVLNKFARAYENVGIFEQRMTPEGPRTLRAELTADNEEKVFNSISATAFLIVNLGTVDEVQLYMKTTTGGTAGRFHISRQDAAALYAGGKPPQRKALEEYYVRKVIY
jgi:hypothetical protein